MAVATNALIIIMYVQKILIITAIFSKFSIDENPLRFTVTSTTSLLYQSPAQLNQS